MNNTMFFMPCVQLAHDQIFQVCILKAVGFDDVVHLPRVIINQSHCFEGEEGAVAIDQLRAVGFYNDEQYKVVDEGFERLIQPLRANNQCY